MDELARALLSKENLVKAIILAATAAIMLVRIETRLNSVETRMVRIENIMDYLVQQQLGSTIHRGGPEKETPPAAAIPGR